MLTCFLCLICNAVYPLILIDASDINTLEVGFVILTQENEYHDELFRKRENQILRQAEDLDHFHFEVYKSHSLQDDEVGHWTIFPLLEKLSNFNKFQWFFFFEDITEFNLKNLKNVFKKYNSSEDVFVGYVLQDNDATIIHHFADPASLSYPHFSSGFFISLSLLHRLVSKLPVDDEYSFSVDPKYEFSKFVWDSGNGVKLQHESQFCLTKTSENCATWIAEKFPKCGVSLPSDKLQVAVKTCQKFHHDRISIVKNTWASQAKNLNIFSDIEDKSIPTVKVDVENVARGHCEKTLTIFKYYLKNNISFQWLAVVDDDTIISIERLIKLLSCYDASDTVAIGERYGYGVAHGVGYDYITGGGGMIFSFPVVKDLYQNCRCPTIDSPDDMIIGMCLKRSGIPVIHSPYFHQARPVDYASDFLKPFTHISFHKYWNINPHSVYQEWLQDTSDDRSHVEL